MDATFLQDRITALKAQIVAVEGAIVALNTDLSIQSYTIDTGQGRQTVTRQDIVRLQGLIDGLMNQIAVYEARLNGSGVSIGWAAW